MINCRTVTCDVVYSPTMAESGIDLTFDDQTYDSTSFSNISAASSAMAHLQPMSATSG